MTEKKDKVDKAREDWKKERKKKDKEKRISFHFHVIF